MGFNNDKGDDDLTNLNWLQNKNLLQNMRVSNDLKVDIVRFINEEHENLFPSNVSSIENNNSVKKNETLSRTITPCTYNPRIHIQAKPPFSFSSLIFMAIESSPNKALPVKDIYAWIVEHFPYYKNSPSGWKNTVRHNLSLNKCFRKIDKTNDKIIPLVGKGFFWCVDSNLRPSLLQAVRRTSAHIYPYLSTIKTNINSNPTFSRLKNYSTSNKLQSVKKIFTCDQLPQLKSSTFLTKKLIIPIINRESKEADAAESMLTLTCYKSENSNVLVFEDKSDSNKTSQAFNSTTHLNINPPDDHNYFSRTCIKKKLPLEKSEIKNKINYQCNSKVMVFVEKEKTREKRKIGENDEDGLKGAQALLNLAFRNTRRVSSVKKLTKN